MKASFIIFLFLLLYPFSPIIGQDISFYREDITFELTGNFFKINGNYFFRNQNPDPIKTRLIYPFPTDSIYGNADSVFAFDIIQNRDNLKQVTQNAAGIELLIHPFDTTVINIEYRQELKSNKAEYILTTTKGWKKAFEEVHYKLISDTNIVVHSFSYQPDTSLIVDDKLIYLWERKNFMPDKDFSITFDIKN